MVIATRPERADVTMQECVDLGVGHVRMHRSVGGGSVSGSAAALGRSHGITVIDGGCPLMFPPTDDKGHRGMRRVLTVIGRVVPRKV